MGGEENEGEEGHDARKTHVRVAVLLWEVKKPATNNQSPTGSLKKPSSSIVMLNLFLHSLEAYSLGSGETRVVVGVLAVVLCRWLRDRKDLF
jgi:hypothetical protein